jgi:hypothetical protein
MTLKNGVVTYMNNHTQPNPEQWARARAGPAPSSCRHADGAC